MQGSLSIHESLKLSRWIVVLNILLILRLLLGSLGIGLGDCLVHLSLHLGSLDFGVFDSRKIVITNLQ